MTQEKNNAKNTIYPHLRRKTLSEIVSRLMPGVLGMSVCIPCIQAAEIEEIVIVEERDSGYRADESSIGKLTQSLLDTPQSITSITSEMLEDRGAMSLDDAMRNVPGITLGAGEFSWQGNNPSIRGFSSLNDMYVDGMRDSGSYTRDPFNLETVEVLLGPSSMVFGRGSTGGIINQSTKQPVQREIRSLHMNLGNSDTRRLTADFNQPLGMDTGTALRVNAVYHEAGVPGRDTVETERRGLAPSLSLDLGSATRLTLSHMYMGSESIPDYGLPWIEGAPADVDRGNYYGFDDDYLETDANITTVKLDHSLNEAVTFNAMVRVGDYSRKSRITEPQVESSVTRDTPPETVTVYRMMFSGESDEKIVQGQLNMTAAFSTGALSHTLVAGVETSSEKSDPAYGFAGVTPFFDYDLPTPVTNLANPGGDFTGTTARRLQADTTGETLAVFILDTIKLGEQWNVVLGLRRDRFETDYREQRFDENGVEQSNARYVTKDTETSYRTALVYKPVPEGTVYLGWGTSFNPSSEAISFISSGRGLSTSNAFLDPEENESLELGVKWSLLNDQLGIDGAIFSITKDNARVSDPMNPGFNTLAGEQEVTGLSLNVSGSIGDSLKLVAGYTFLDGEQYNSITGTTSDIQNLAENAFSVWADWAATSALSFGAGARYLDERTSGGNKWTDDYWALDAMAMYRLNEHTTFKFNLTNVTDEYYIDQIHPWHVIPGPGRSAVFAVNFDY